MLNGDASSHPFHSLPPPPPPPPHSHQTLFSSFGYHRLSPSSADEPRYGQGSSPLASCSRWISFFSFSVCVESFLSARPLPPLPRGVCTRLRAGVRKRARGRACRRVHVCVRVCMEAGCACGCVHTCMPSAPSPARPLQRCCSALQPSAPLLAHPTLTTPVSPAAGQGWRQHRAAHGPCPPCRVCGDPQKRSPGSVPGAGRGSTVPGWQPRVQGPSARCSLPRGALDAQQVALTRSGLCPQSGKGLWCWPLSWGMPWGLAQHRQCPARPWGPSLGHGQVTDAAGLRVGSAWRADIWQRVCRGAVHPMPMGAATGCRGAGGLCVCPCAGGTASCVGRVPGWPCW